MTECIICIHCIFGSYWLHEHARDRDCYTFDPCTGYAQDLGSRLLNKSKLDWFKLSE